MKDDDFKDEPGLGFSGTTIMTTTSFVILLTTIAAASCTKKSPVSDPVKSKPLTTDVRRPNNQPAPARILAAPADPSSPQTDSQVPTPNAVVPSSPKSTLQHADDCDTAVELAEESSIFLPENKVFVTRIMSPCLAPSGQKGHKRNAGWMAMGFPCTGGEGRIDWKGNNYNRPKMVSFLMDTSCPMAPTDHGRIKSEAFKIAKIPETAQLIAFNPFGIQYWELPGFDDADTSFNVDLRSGSSLDDAWTNFIKGKPLKAFLVGRENAWVAGNKIYAVEGEILYASKNRFTFKATTARQLTVPELEKIKTKCEALRPERACSSVF